MALSGQSRHISLSGAQLVTSALRTLRLLYRAELSAMVALSALAGYLFAGGGWHGTALLVTAGAGLLAAGCSALNQWQEQDLDLRMLRTRHRPLPEAILSPATALLLAALALAAGTLALTALPDSRPLLLGTLAVIWYNAIYTPLKRRTPFAALPGAVCGALPPLMGWAATGSVLWTQKPLILAGTLFVWQIPHTWLLLCRYRDDLKQSGLPDLFNRIPTTRLLQINNCWIGALFACYLLFPTFGYISSPTLVIVFLAGLSLLFLSILNKKINTDLTARARFLFHRVNVSMALLLTILILDRLVVG